MYCFSSHGYLGSLLCQAAFQGVLLDDIIASRFSHILKRHPCIYPETNCPEQPQLVVVSAGADDPQGPFQHVGLTSEMPTLGALWDVSGKCRHQP